MEPTKRVWIRESIIPKRDDHILPIKSPDRTSSGISTVSTASIDSDDWSRTTNDFSSYEWKEACMVTPPADDQNEFRIIRYNDEEFTVPVDCPDVVLAAESAPDDLAVGLKEFHEPAVVECLQRRYRKSMVYTNTGPVLLALNPFKHMPDLYESTVMEQYWLKAENGSSEHLPPHVYAIADTSFRSMMRGLEMRRKKHNQSILVSGESGSGKTVTTKYLMKYLAALSQRAVRQGQKGAQRAYLQASPSTQQQKTQPSIVSRSVSSVTMDSSIESQVLQSNPILESFGNARTVRNDNSSRFGKFIEMQFSETGRLMGTCIETYLLEKVRLVHQAPGERNYHIFYEILSNEELKKTVYFDGTAEPQDFTILSSSGTVDRRDEVRDCDTFKQLCQAMKTMEFSSDECQSVFQVTAAVLHASNLTFREVAHEEAGLEPTNKHLTHICQLLEIKLSALNDALCFKSLVLQGKTILKPLTLRKADSCLEAFLKALYGALFSFLVKRINQSIASECQPSAIIGVLDIFGFECFQTNSFEQLCINYCNETLQQQFNTAMLKNEQAAYAAEGLDWEFIKFPENQDVLDLLESGIMVVLDDMCRTPGSTDTIFSQQLVKACEGRPRFESHKQGSKFVIQHYAGAVEYTATGFVEKNRDDLPTETVELLKSTTSSFVRQLADLISTPTAPASDVTTATRRDRMTVGGYFRQQVMALRQKIDCTTPHYVRCIKPNEHLIPDEFDAAMVAQQLRCGGILQAVSLTREGFTLHYTHKEFLKRYGILVSGDVRSQEMRLESDRCKKIVDCMLDKLEHTEHDNSGKDVDDIPIIFGNTKVLLKHHAFEKLESMLGKIQSQAATKLNAIFRRFLNRVAFVSVREAFRFDLKEQGYTFETWFQENRAVYYTKRDRTSKRMIHIPNLVSQRRAMFVRRASDGFDSQLNKLSKKSIHIENPAWVVVDGLWVRNAAYKPLLGH